jgi:hypothetical protein
MTELRSILPFTPRIAAENHFVGANQQYAIHPTQAQTKKQSCKDYLCGFFALVLAMRDHTVAFL